MSQIIANVLREPRGDLYERLIDFAASQCTLALLVVRPTLPLNPEATELLSDLEPFMVSKKSLARWPGTELLDGVAEVYVFSLTSESTEKLKRATSRLYGWCQPYLPEDLCLLLREEEPWLVSISHEGDAYFTLDEEQLASLLNGLPELREILSWE
jgi:hypothetical protein